jgi:hypothetical protein
VKPYWEQQDTAYHRYRSDAHFRTLVDTFMDLLWGGKYTPSELREASILAATQVECMRIRPLIFDPNNYTIEQGILAARPGLETE